MIIPNLMVSDIARSVTFYREIVGLSLDMAIDADRLVRTNGLLGEAPVFATLSWKDDQLMLQTVRSLAAELPVFDPDQRPVAGGTVYIRDMDPRPVAERAGEAVIKGPEKAWYGMMEVFLQDPDGHVVCVGQPEGGMGG